MSATSSPTATLFESPLLVRLVLPRVYGIPIPQGSAKAFYRPGMRFPVVTHDNKATLRPWRALITDAALQAVARGQRPIGGVVFPAGAVRLELSFAMPRPKSAPKRVTRPTKKPDLDKLIRSVKDALKGVVYADDSQVVEVNARKIFTDWVGLEAQAEFLGE